MCNDLASVVIPEGVHTIKDSNFYLCPNLKRVSIPSSVTCIDEYAFYSDYNDFVVDVKKGSYAEEYCKTHGLNYNIVQ